MSSLQEALDNQRIQEPLGGYIRSHAPVMAFVFEDTPQSKVVGLFTLAFAKDFCEADPLYTWRAV